MRQIDRLPLRHRAKRLRVLPVEIKGLLQHCVSSRKSKKYQKIVPKKTRQRQDFREYSVYNIQGISGTESASTRKANPGF
jgi:hypothetical protein